MSPRLRPPSRSVAAAIGRPRCGSGARSCARPRRRPSVWRARDRADPDRFSGAGVSAGEPAAGQLLGSRTPFLDGDGKAQVILPHTVDLEEALGETFAADVELLHDASAVGIARNDADLEPVQLQLLEGEAHQHDDGLGDVRLTGAFTVDPVADGRALQSTARDVVEIDLAGQLLVDEDAEGVGVVSRSL